MEQTLEKEIKHLKRHGGMIGLNQDEAALDRLITITPHLTQIVKLILRSFPRSSTQPNVSEVSEHYILTLQ